MLWSYFLLQSRMNRTRCLLASATLGLLVASHALGELVMVLTAGAWSTTVWGMPFSRWLILELFQPLQGRLFDQ